MSNNSCEKKHKESIFEIRNFFEHFDSDTDEMLVEKHLQLEKDMEIRKSVLSEVRNIYQVET